MAETAEKNQAQKRREQENQPLITPERLLFAKKALVRSALFFAALFVVAWVFREDLTALVKWPLIRAFDTEETATILLQVIDLFMVHVKVCFYVTLILGLPFALALLWRSFLKAKKQRGFWAGFFAPMLGLILFFGGVAFGYFVVMPLAFDFLVSYSLDDGGLFFQNTAMPHGENAMGGESYLQVSMREHVSLTMGMLLAFGIGFQAPLVMATLARLSLVTRAQFTKFRPIAIVLLAAVSAILTPPDPWTMLLMLLPLFVLYQAGIWAAWFLEKREKRR